MSFLMGPVYQVPRYLHLAGILSVLFGPSADHNQSETRAKQ